MKNEYRIGAVGTQVVSSDEDGDDLPVILEVNALQARETREAGDELACLSHTPSLYLCVCVSYRVSFHPRDESSCLRDQISVGDNNLVNI